MHKYTVERALRTCIDTPLSGAENMHRYIVERMLRKCIDTSFRER